MIERIKLIREFLEFDLPKDQYLIVNSAWLAMLGIRVNGDLDLIFSENLRRTSFNEHPLDTSFGLPGPLERRLRVQAHNHQFGGMFGARGIDDVIRRFGIEVDGICFIQPRFYLELKAHNVAKGRSAVVGPFWRRWIHRWGYKHERDFRALNTFFRKGKHRIPPFDVVPSDAWVGPEALAYMPDINTTAI